MSPISTPSFQPGDVTITGATSIEITNKVLGTASTEYSHTLQSNVRQIIIKTQNGNAKLQFSFTATESSTKYITVWPGSSFHVSDIRFAGKTLYIQSNKNSTTVEIVELY